MTPVCDETTEDTIWWDNNRHDAAQFETLKADFAHARSRTCSCRTCWRRRSRLSAAGRVICEYAWHAPFIRHLLIVREDRPDRGRLTVIDLPSFKADPARHGTRGETVIALDLAQGLVLIGGTQYAGEMKKAVFTVLNYLLPERGAMPMHCSANVGKAGDSAVFFGLSGTGKTTLSADPTRTLIGDDEHGWSERGIFNFEGGCYAKVIRLSAEAEPEIFAATQTWGTVLENVTIDAEGRVPDFDDGSATENTRAAYPLSAIANASMTGLAPTPKTIVMVTADAFGVLPPIARLTPAGHVSLPLGLYGEVAGTERRDRAAGNFLHLLRAPFIPASERLWRSAVPAHPRHNVSCFPVNTG
jgi:phosphoenolpyruvate carboxykinase (ATP)